ESLRCFNSRERIVNSSSSDKVSTPSLIASFCKEALTMRMTCNFSRSLSLIACFISLVSSSDNDNYFSPTLFIYVYVQLQISFFFLFVCPLLLFFFFFLLFCFLSSLILRFSDILPFFYLFFLQRRSSSYIDFFLRPLFVLDFINPPPPE